MRWRRVFDIGGGYPAAVAVVALVTALALPLRLYLPIAAITLLYVPVIIGVARVWGIRVAGVAAVAAFLATDFFFVEPYYRLTVETPSEWVELLMFLVVALVSGQQTARLRQSEQAALTGKAELELLNRLSSRMASEKSESVAAEFTVTEITSVLGATRAALYAAPSAGEPPTLLASSGGADGGADELEFVSWVLTSSKAIGLTPPESTRRAEMPASVAADTAVPGKVASEVYVPLQTSDSLEGVLCVRFPVERELGVEQSGLLAAIASLSASSLERHRLEEGAARAEALREADRLKSTLVSSVSHELKTPLAAATARVTALLEEGGACDDARVHGELLVVADDLGRLNASIGDLIDVSRLESDEWRPSFEVHDITDILGTVLSRLPASERERVRFDLALDLPPVKADFAQLVRAFCNIVENALTYSPSDSPVFVSARLSAGDVLVTIEDRGPGVLDAEKTIVFEKFYRGSASAASPAGTGLGLTIAAEIIRMHAGRVWVEDAEEQGARFVVALPKHIPAPATSAAKED